MDIDLNKHKEAARALLWVVSEVRANTADELDMEVKDKNFRGEGCMAGTPGT